MTRATCCILAVLIATAALAGCGNRGALVLPDQAPAKKHKSVTEPKAAPGAAVPSEADSGMSSRPN